ncbi:MAG: adenylate/guanylate cyclase domain-containing protein [Pseudomonadota bacterium]
MTLDRSDLERGAADRLERMLASEEVERMRNAAAAITGSFLVIGPLLVLLTGWPDAAYYHALILLFIGSVWLQYAVTLRRPDLVAPDYLFPAVNCALLSFVLAYPNPFSDFAGSTYAPSVMMRFGNSIYFVLILASLAFSFSPRVVLWGGVCAVGFWSLARWWVISQPGIELYLGDDAEAIAAGGYDGVLEAAYHPRYVDPGLWMQEVVVILLLAGVLAMIVRGSRRLVLRRAAEERRGANLARYLPARMAERMAEADEPFLEDREAEVAVLFTDIVGFTGWAEAHSPDEVVALLREVHGFVAEEVFRADGVLDKFIGDGAMATFGVARTEAPARRALDCAEAVLARARDLNRERAARGEGPVRLSVGAHLGPVTIGDVGAAGRMELAVVGDAVNVASRLEALNRSLGSGAVVSDALMRSAGGPAPGWTAQGETALAGREGTVSVWTRPLETDDPARPGPGAADHADANRPSAAAD